ncbi:glycoside hydrolase family 28 protein [Aquimarina agarilytica]|uniref:glycoside hydrolase family 28 protein n=1 Tax=Aquimarina agarilytica TaxID=1087449 RepID=UPI000288C524|nr:glycosyl hydrolase family 28 protein [Aquimarina agarilytica]
MLFKKILLGCFLLLFLSCVTKKKTFDIRDFGAQADTLTVNTIAIQKAINACHKQGGGKVVVSNGTYITGTVLLKNNVHLVIHENGVLKGSSNPLDYQSIDMFTDATGQERGNCLIGAVNAKNIGVSGKGIIDGNGAAFLHKNLVKERRRLHILESNKTFGKNRPFLLRFVKSSKIHVKGIQLREPAAWTCHFYQSSNIQIEEVSIYSHANFNNDGIDLDSSSAVSIKNCTIDTGDDAICFKTTSPIPTHDIKVSECSLKSEWGAIKFGTESMGDFYNILVTDCVINDTRGGGIKILSVDGANITNVTIKNIKMNAVDMPIFVRLGERLRTYRNTPKQKVGSIDKLLIKNIQATTQSIEKLRVNPPSGILITGTPAYDIGTVKLEDISINLPGGGKKANIKLVDEQVAAYPEFSFFGMLPAYGIYGRHIKKITLSNVNFKIENPDERAQIILEDVDNKIIN